MNAIVEPITDPDVAAKAGQLADMWAAQRTLFEQGMSGVELTAILRGESKTAADAEIWNFLAILRTESALVEGQPARPHHPLGHRAGRMKVQLRGGQQGLRALGRSLRTLERLVTRQVLKIVFDVLLLTVGLLLVVASRFRRRIQSQITRDVLFEIASDDGVARRFGLHAATRTVSLEAVSEQRPDTTVRFGCALDGIRALVSTRTTVRIVEGMNYGNTRLEGNPVLLLWFHALTRTVVPIGSTRRPRLWRLPPIKVREPERHAPWAARITREPAIDQLDPTWQVAWVARAKLLQVRACNGEPLPPAEGEHDDSRRSMTSTETLNDRARGWLRFQWEKTTTPDDWSSSSEPLPWWDRDFTPMCAFPRFELIIAGVDLHRYVTTRCNVLCVNR